LRFFAFLLVFVSHALPPGAWDWIPHPFHAVFVGLSLGGAYGVDLFFALSSWLITTLLIREQKELGRIDARAFYIRRILRIWPLYFAFLLVRRPAFSLLLPDQMSAAYIAAFSLLAGNWACVILGYPATVASPLWSVSIEEQFYLAWQLVLRKWFHCLPRVLIGLLVLSSLTRFVLVALHVMHPGIWCNTFARLDPIAAGALLAVLSHGEALKLTPRARLLCFSGERGWLCFSGERCCLSRPDDSAITSE